MIWYILIYTTGLIACWFLIAYQRDVSEYENDKFPTAGIFLSWLFIGIVLLALCIGLVIERLGKFKVFNPSLKYFKKNDKHREE